MTNHRSTAVRVAAMTATMTGKAEAAFVLRMRDLIAQDRLNRPNAVFFWPTSIPRPTPEDVAALRELLALAGWSVVEVLDHRDKWAAILRRM